MSLFVTRTSLGTIRPLGSEAERAYGRVTDIIARNVSASHARILADPVPLGDNSGIDWYVEDDGDVLALSELPEAEAAAVKDALAAIVADILAVAERIEGARASGQKPIAATLRRAVTFPGEENIWAIRNGEELRPVIVAWGYETHDSIATKPFDISIRADRKPPPPPPRPVAASVEPPTRAGAIGAGAVPSAGAGPSPGLVGPARSPTRPLSPLGIVPWLLAFLLLVFAAATASLLLPACGMRTPFGTIAFGWPSDVGCSARTEATLVETHAPDTIARDLVETDRIERDLVAMREAAERWRLRCRMAAASPVVPSLPPPEPPPVPDAEFDQAIDNRGEFQVTLLWAGPDDLDLAIVCPSAALIAFPQENRTACGGVLDVDANANQASMRDPPVENITFATGLAEPGQYQVQVRHYRSRTGRYPVPYRVRVRDKNGERIYDGRLVQPGDQQLVTTFAK